MRVRIEVEHEEALHIAGFLKLKARHFESLAEASMGESKRLLMASAAQLDTFADKLYAPFLTPEALESINERADIHNKEITKG